MILHWPKSLTEEAPGLRPTTTQPACVESARIATELPTYDSRPANPELRERHALRPWLEVNHATSSGIFVRIFKSRAGVTSVSFEDVLDEGLCFGWSESARLPGNASSYLQRFTPRKTRGTTSSRNRQHAARLVQEGRMTDAGMLALGSDALGTHVGED